MGGYERPEGVKVDFEGHPRKDMHGLEITMRRISIEEHFELDDLRDGVRLTENAPKEDQRKALGVVIDFVVDRIVSWNVTKGGVPVPVMADAFWKDDTGYFYAILERWQDKVTGVPAPLDQNSPDGEPFPEQSLPME